MSISASNKEKEEEEVLPFNLPPRIIINFITSDFRWQHETWLLTARTADLDEETRQLLRTCEQATADCEVAGRNDRVTDKATTEKLNQDYPLLHQLRRKIIVDEDEEEAQTSRKRKRNRPYHEPWEKIGWDDLRSFTREEFCMMMTL